MKRLAAIVYSTDHEFWTGHAVSWLRQTVNPDLTDIIVVDNGSGAPFRPGGDLDIRYEENVGGNAVFHRWLRDAWFDPETYEYLAFLHCDLMVRERHWDERVAAHFDADPLLSLIGFVGSNQIDARGGRGGGTMLNFTGAFYEEIGQLASPSSHHGRRVRDLNPAVVVDHLAMIFRRTTLEMLPPQEGNFAPEHFYDRILSCEVCIRGERVAVLGIECDHFSGGIGPGMVSADNLRRRWLEAEGITFDPADTYTAVYLESERRFFEHYGHWFPVEIDSNWRVTHR